MSKQQTRNSKRYSQKKLELEIIRELEIEEFEQIEVEKLKNLNKKQKN